MKEKQFYVLWTYIANYSRLIPIKAETPEIAREESCGYFSDDFKKKATVFVFDTPPTLIYYKGEKMTLEAYREASKEDR